MMVALIVATAAAFAVPSYRQHTLRAHRVEAKRALLDVAAAQEKYYLQNNAYAGPSSLSTAPPAGLGIPATTDNGRYAIAIASGGADAYSATATAQGAQAGDTRCASLGIDEAGRRTANNADCWN
jgi:type IV pilus assembly protein PilE